MTISKNRNPIKQMFFTFPKTEVDKSSFRDALLQFAPEYYKVVQETHKDGTLHLHALVKFKNKFSKAHVLKKLKLTYPNDYQRIHVDGVRSIKHAIQYMSKEDLHPLESEPYKESRNPQANFRESFARELGYKSVKDLLQAREAHTNDVFCLESRILKHEYDYKDYGESKKLPYDILKLRSKIELFPECEFSKDDITKLSNYYNLN